MRLLCAFLCAVALGNFCLTFRVHMFVHVFVCSTVFTLADFPAAEAKIAVISLFARRFMNFYKRFLLSASPNCTVCHALGACCTISISPWDFSKVQHGG